MAAETEELSVSETTSTDDKKRLDLQVEVQNRSACERHVTVTISQEDVDRYREKTLTDLRGKAEVPGFRPGRAPRKIVESRFKDQVRDQVKSSLLMDSMGQISEDNVFTAISEPDFDVDAVDLPSAGPMRFEFNIEVRPEFDMPEWKGLEITRPVYEVTDEDADRRWAQITNFSPENEEVAGAAESGDMLTVELVVTHQGREVVRTSDLQVQVAKELSFPDASWKDFDKAATGKSAGDTITEKLTISPNAEIEEVRGQELDVSLTIAKVERPKAIKVDQAYLSKYGFESAEELRGLVRDALTRQYEYHQSQAVRRQVTDKLTKGADWDLPPAMLRRQARRELDRVIIELRRSGFSDDQIRSHINSLSQDSLATTSRALKEHFILEKLAESEKVEAEPADYDREVALIARQSGESPRRVRARLEKQGQLDSLRNQIIENKVIGLITSHATIKDVPEVVSPWSRETNSYAVSVALGGKSAAEASIPEAKHAGGGEEPLPNTADKR